MEWEQIDDYHQRARVFGGWLVKAYEQVFHTTDFNGTHTNLDMRVAMAFVPDANHAWVLEK